MAADPESDVRRLVRLYHTGVVWHCLNAIARLGVADRLAGGPVGVSILAADVGAREQLLWRVLRLLGDHGFFTFRGRDVALTDFGRLLCKEHPSSAWSMYAAVGLPDVAHALEESLRTGTVAAQRVLGAPFWQYLAEHPAEQAAFDDYMRTQTNWLVETCVGKLQWPRTGTVADIGGGVGTLLSAILAAAPGLKGILVDQEQVVARSLLADEVAAGRCEIRAADLFDPAPRADIYLMSYLLHDWPDSDAARILDAVGERAPASARLRLFEYVVPDDGTPHESKLSDVGMLLLFGGGRERTADEFRQLLGQSGWRLDDITEWGPTSMIEASRAGG